MDQKTNSVGYHTNNTNNVGQPPTVLALHLEISLEWSAGAAKNHISKLCQVCQNARLEDGVLERYCARISKLLQVCQNTWPQSLEVIMLVD